MGEVTMRLSAKALDMWEFRRDPFADEPRDASELFWSDEHQKLRNHLLSVILQNDAVAVSAPVGWGKTLLRIALAQELLQDDSIGHMVVQVRSISKKGINPTTIQMAILRDLEQEPKGNMDSESLSVAVERTLKARSQGRKRIALFIDEAHLLSDESFKALKNLLDIKDGFRRVMSVVLLGQEELASILARNALREVGARIACVQPGPLSVKGGEVRAYIRSRVAIATLDRAPLGDEADEVTLPFDESGLAAIEQAAQGVGKKVTQMGVRPDVMTVSAICSCALEYAANLGVQAVNEDIVRAARAKVLAGV